jgi:hypothetical protein
MTRWARILLATLLGGIGLVEAASLTEAAGPWRGEVVDAATGEPLEGVIVLAVWDKISPGMIHPQRDYHDVDEVVTDTQGLFVIPERRLLTANPFVTIDGPNLHMFKPGYGRWRDRGLPKEFDRYDMWRLMEKEPVAFEMPRLTSRMDRLKALPSRPSDVSPARIPRFIEALNNERLFLGLSPLRVNEH